MAKSSRSEHHDALEQLQTLSDQAAHWIATNPKLVVGVIVAVLAMAGSYGGFAAWSASREDAASAALAEVRREYLDSLGQGLGSEVVELANPEIRQRVRDDAIQRYLQVAAERDGTAAGAVARLEAGDLLAESGDVEAAQGIWMQAIESGDASKPLRGMLLERVAAADERQERWRDAAQGYEKAGEIDSYPPRHLALASAARCYLYAGQSARAIELMERVEREAPEVSLPPHLSARIAELRAASDASRAAPEAAPPAEPMD
ncbi:MAG: hypothetical protein JSU66_12610 [Deltaproteobacteria bacterium]|nr:MAG: hypothetical protein JSU66_12610 [Deltaproteobacteria bacterium]